MAYRVPENKPSVLLSSTPNFRPSLSGTALGQSLTADSEEWVVFSPSTDNNTIGTPTSGTISRLSGFGSLRYDDDELEEEEEGLEAEEDDEDDDDEDYDEDIDLRGFRDPYHQGPVMLPQHDGLGTFQTTALSRQASVEKIGQEVPVLASRSSFTNARIQAWRMEQSRILLDEIERATKGRLGLKQTEAQKREEEMASMSDVGLEEENEKALADEAADHTTFWERLRRRLVQDIMGLDDMVLQIIFGEALPTDFDETASGASTPTGSGTGLKRMDSSWEERLFERLARELGILAQHYTPHVAKAAFSTYVTGKSGDKSSTEVPNAKPRSAGTVTPKTGASKPLVGSSSSHTSSDPLASTRQFHPTISHAQVETDSHAANWGIEDGPLSSSLLSASSEARVDAEIVREYWEKELNVRMLFSYLKSKLATPQASSSTAAARRPSVSSTSTARNFPLTTPNQPKKRFTNSPPIHHQHPLIAQSQSVNHTKAKRVSPIASLTSVLGVGMGGFRSGSSCASQSTTKKSGQKAGSKGSVNSKHYWDVGSTVGSSRSSCVGGPVWADV
ncbi:hypothetical protein ABW19_dt0209100 [Dactylella cylindrospora]|nr:hypothetical protein ABW19_dt0209100 [Dactylella cylindrospora]